MYTTNLFLRVIVPFIAMILVLFLTGCTEIESEPESTSIMTTSKSVVSIDFNEDISIDIESATGSDVTFTATTEDNCTVLSSDTSSITLTAATDLTDTCTQTITIKADGFYDKNITVNVLDPMTMDIGEGLLIKYVNIYTWKYNDSGSGGDTDVTFWHPDANNTDGWYALGSYIQTNYTNLSVTDVNAYPVIVVKDSKNLDLLRAPTEYTFVWNDGGSGGDHDGSVYIPVCEDGYKAMGAVVGDGYSTPSTDAVRCVREDFTLQGEVGSYIYNDSGNGADRYLSIWGISEPDVNTDTRIPLGTGTMIASPSHASSGCDLATANLLLIPASVYENSENQSEPLLTGYTSYDASKPKYFSSVTVPFTLIPEASGSENNDYNVHFSPFYRIQRKEVYASLAAYDNKQSSTATPLSYTTESSFDSEESSSFSQSVGLEVTVEGGVKLLGVGAEISTTISTEFGWEQSTSSSYGTRSSVTAEQSIPAGKFGQMVQVSSTFQAIDMYGNAVGTALSGGSSNIKYLQYPLD